MFLPVAKEIISFMKTNLPKVVYADNPDPYGICLEAQEGTHMLEQILS